MKKEIDKAIDFCIDALSIPNDNPQEALGNDAEVLEVIKNNSMKKELLIS